MLINMPDSSRSGLLAAEPNAKLIGWDFPFVSQELQSRFGLHGYVAAYVLPEEFQTNCSGVEYAESKEAEYAVALTHSHAIFMIPIIIIHVSSASFSNLVRNGVFSILWIAL